MIIIDEIYGENDLFLIIFKENLWTEGNYSRSMIHQIVNRCERGNLFIGEKHMNLCKDVGTGKTFFVFLYIHWTMHCNQVIAMDVGLHRYIIYKTWNSMKTSNFHESEPSLYWTCDEKNSKDIQKTVFYGL